MTKSYKNTMYASVAVLVLSGVFGWTLVSSPSYASGDHDHATEEKHEDEHDHGKQTKAVDEHGHGAEDGDEHAEGVVALTDEQIAAAKIEVTAALSGALAREIIVPGRIVTAADRMAQIVPKVGGTVFEARKNLGDTVEKGEVLALIESREMAEAVAEYLAAQRASELAHTVYKREKSLWDKKVTAEQDYLTAKNTSQEASIRFDLAKQRLQAIGHDGKNVSGINTRFHELRSPIAGRVIGRELTLGEYVDTTHTAFTIADLGLVWVDAAIAPADLSSVQEGQTVSIQGDDTGAKGRLIFVGPAVDADTRAAKAIIEFDNAANRLRPGQFVNVAIATSAEQAGVLVPKAAIQTIEGSSVVFVRTGHGFEKRVVTTGRADSRNIEVISGLQAGEPVATSATFRLKAELGKSEAGHEH